MHKKVLWLIQFAINCSFMIYLASFPSNAVYSGSGWSILIGLFLIIVAVIAAIILTNLVTER